MPAPISVATSTEAAGPQASSGAIDDAATSYREKAQGLRINTELAIYAQLEKAYPDKHITVVSADNCNLLAFQASGQIQIKPTESNGTRFGPLVVQQYLPPVSRLDKANGHLTDRVLFGRYEIFWQDHAEPFLLYLVEGRDNTQAYPHIKINYIISDSPSTVNDLILAAGKYSNDLHGEIWVYDQGMWRKDKDLWRAINIANWDVVILEHKMKKQLIRDFNGFFDGEETYKRLKVPWKRGLIFHGPPGNGKTISLKAAMHMLYQRKIEVPTLYVKAIAGPRSLNMIFAKARATAPCLLVFEDLDSIISETERSFFLNQVDGLAVNDGILIVGTTNHLERLDPGISKRPSRFDRKYLFPDPDFDQRVLYAEFWRRKLNETDGGDADQGQAKDKDLEFPEELCKPIAKITDKFSFAYMQEAFVATLLSLARGVDDDDEEDDENDSDKVAEVNFEFVDEEKDPEIEKLVLWKEFQKQVKVLRKQIGNGQDAERNRKVKPLNATRGGLSSR